MFFEFIFSATLYFNTVCACVYVCDINCHKNSYLIIKLVQHPLLIIKVFCLCKYFSMTVDRDFTNIEIIR